jgi:hypothetical protein
VFLSPQILLVDYVKLVLPLVRSDAENGATYILDASISLPGSLQSQQRLIRGIAVKLKNDPPLGLHARFCRQLSIPFAQLTGAICTQEESYRPGLWIVLRDSQSPPNEPLSSALLERVGQDAEEFVKRMDLA